MRIVVVGAGAMGMLFGGRLARAGHDVTFVETDAARVAMINAQGVCENDESIPCRAGLPGALRGEADLLILFTKALHTGAAIRANAGLLRTGGVVLTLQNGLGNGAVIGEVVGQENVLVGITNWPADIVGNGRIHVGGTGTVKLWSLDGADRPVVHRVAEILDGARLAATAEPTVEVAIWQKVIFNAALNGVAALTRMTVGQIGDCADTRAVALGMVTEGIAAALASGVTVDAAGVRAQVDFALVHHRDHKASMLQDIEAGRVTEVEAIHGGLLLAARSAGLAVPTLETCTALLRGLDQANQLRRKT